MKDTRPAILHVLTDRAFGGALSWLFCMLSEADHDRFRYGVILPEGSEAARKLAALPVIVIALPIKERSWSPADLWKLRRAIAAFDPDIVQTHGSLSARMAGLFAAPRAFLLLTKHCVFSSPRSRHPYFARCLNLCIRPFTHAAIATAECAKRMLVREGMKNACILTVPNGAQPLTPPTARKTQELQKKLGLDACLTVGFCGRLEQEKNPRFLLALARELADRELTFRILVIGDGTQRRTLAARAAKMGLADRLCFVGYAKDVAPYLTLCDVQINCSLLSETSNMALLEGFSLGIPAVASSLDGNRETVIHGKNGFIYPKGDVRACADLVCRLAADNPLRQKLSLGARRVYDSCFRAALMARRCEVFYTALTRHSSKKH